VPKPKVFVTRVIPEAGLARVRDFCDAEIWTEQMPPARDVFLKKIKGVDGILSLLTENPIDGAVMDACGPQLKVISNYAVGFNNIVVPDATARGICVGNTPGVLTDATADMAFALLISAARWIVKGADDSRNGKWRTWEPMGYIGQDLIGRTIGIIGMGRIGHAMAKRCRGGWDMKILYHDKYRNEKAEQEFGAKQVDLDTLLKESDFVSVHTDLNAETKGMFNYAAFKKMKRTAVFVNSARGPIHVTADLARALVEGLIFAAGLDVTDPEPPRYGDKTDGNNDLLKLPNCVIQPHTASATVSSRNGMAEIAADNLINGLSGKPLRCWVNPEVADKRRK
jgi:glyoxylate reductase